jgi:aminoglycoside phosphotransferase (APT) family kinase protein
MTKERYIGTLNPGDPFRDWLIIKLEDRIDDKKCPVNVYQFPQASHTVCRYDFNGEDYSVVSKFYAKPTGWKKDYDYAKAMDNEYKALKRVARVIDIPKPIAARKDFDCALITEHVVGRSLNTCLKSEDELYDRLTLVARALRKLHDETKSEYRKCEEFARFHKILDQLKMENSSRDKFNRILGKWWHSSLLDLREGCLIHNDANLANYLFSPDKVYALDFESSWEGAHPMHDLGVLAAELKHYFERKKGDGNRAEPYIGHLLWHYSPDLGEFRRNTDALPFFMAMGLLRMARLSLGNGHRAYVFREAKACLVACDQANG